jgi:chromosome segregation ATPase
MIRRIAVAALLLAGIITLPGTTLAATTPKPPSAAATASKNLADARAKLAKAKTDLDVIRRRIALNFEVKPEWKSAKDALDDAKTKYESAAKHVQTALEKTPDYKEQVAKKAKAQAIVDAGAKGTGPSSDDSATKLTEDDLNKAQQDRIDSAIMLKKMQHEADESDATFVAARQKLKEAQDAWDALQSQLDDAMKVDPAYPPVKTEIDQAEAGVKSAQEAYASATKTTPRTPAPKK